jgi:hypothetical protein
MGEFNITGSKVGQVNDSGNNSMVTGGAFGPKKVAGEQAVSKRVFVSHATKDKAIANAFVDLLVHCGLHADDIFCSSLEGMGIPPGQNFLDHIKNEIQNPELVVLMLSQNYFDSAFCLCELGASWAMWHNILPVLIPPATFVDVGGVLTGIQAFKIDEPLKLSEAYEVIVKVLTLKRLMAARWEVKRDEFLKALAPLLKKQEKPSRVAYGQFAELEKKHMEVVEGLNEAEQEIGELKKLVDVLKKAKDQVAVKQVMRQFTSEWDEFKRLTDEAKRAMSELPPVVTEVMYREMTYSEKGYAGSGSEMWEDIASAVEDDYLSNPKGTMDVSLNHDDPTVGRAVETLKCVQQFLCAHDPNDMWIPKPKGDALAKAEEFCEEFKDKMDYRPSFSSRRLWVTFLGLSKLDLCSFQTARG